MASLMPGDLPPTVYDQGVRLQVAQLFNTLLLGGDNTYATDDAQWLNPPDRHQGVTPDGRVFTVGLSNGSAPRGQQQVLQIPLPLLLLAGGVLAYAALKG